MDHAQYVLAGILPSHRENLLYATTHLDKEHFASPTQRLIFTALDKYYEQTGGVMPKAPFFDFLQRKHDDPAKIIFFEEVFDVAVSTPVSDHEFRYAVQALKDLYEDRKTGEAITAAYEILEKGLQVGDEELSGSKKARQYLMEHLGQIDRMVLGANLSPEGDFRDETDDFLAAYIDAKTGKTPVGITTGLPTIDNAIGGIRPGDLALLAAFTSQGKASPLWTPVLTPTGWKKIGELQVGDAIVGSSGKPQAVTGVFDRGVMKTYRVSTADGGSVLTAADHLWQFKLFQDRYFGTKESRVESTLDIAEHLAKGRRVFLPLVAPVEFVERTLPMDPYTLGALLGDGSFRHNEPRFFSHSDDVEIFEFLLVEGEWKVLPKKDGWRLADPKQRTREILKGLGLWSLHSFDKFIPEIYKVGSRETRLALLQGIMDTDGTVSREGQNVELCLSSERLVNDVRELVLSLGGTTGAVRQKPTSRRMAWRVNISYLPEGMSPFRLARKRSLWVKRSQFSRVTDYRRVVSVEEVGEEPVRCISVSAPDHLYVTEDYLVTHNTQHCVQLAWRTAVEQGQNVFFATTETVRHVVMCRIAARHSLHPKFEFPQGLDSILIERGKLSVPEEKIFTAVLQDLKNNDEYGKLHIAQVPRGATLSYVESRMRKHQQDWNIDLFLMDSLNLLKPDARRANEREEMNDILKDSKSLAVSFNDGAGVPIVSPWQMSRDKFSLATNVGFYELGSLSDTSEAEKSPDLIFSHLRFSDSPKRLKFQALKVRNAAIPPILDLDIDFRCSLLAEATGGNFASMDGTF